MSYVYVLQERTTQDIIGVFSTLQRAKIAGRDCDIDPTSWETLVPDMPDPDTWYASNQDDYPFIITLVEVDE